MQVFKSFIFTSEGVTLLSCNIHDVLRNSIPFPNFEVEAIPDLISLPQSLSKPLISLLVFLCTYFYFLKGVVVHINASLQLSPLRENLFVCVCLGTPRASFQSADQVLFLSSIKSTSAESTCSSKLTGVIRSASVATVLYR